jgi:hypothetical protein
MLDPGILSPFSIFASLFDALARCHSTSSIVFVLYNLSLAGFGSSHCGNDLGLFLGWPVRPDVKTSVATDEIPQGRT